VTAPRRSVPPDGTRDSRGFSLPEVTLALGLLGGVLISLSGLFVMSERLVHGGKSQTEALAIARNVMEETNGWSYDGLYRNLGLDGSSASYTVDSRTNPNAARWQDLVQAELGGGHVEILIESVVEAGSPPALTQARCIRVSVTVYWRDEIRPREVRVATVRT